jgi:hypothetical protein
MSDINTLNTIPSSESILNDNPIINSVQDTIKDIKNDVKLILTDEVNNNPIIKESLDEISKVISLEPNTDPNSNISFLPIIKVSSLHLDKYLSFIDDNNIKQIVTLLTNNNESIKDISNIIDLIMADGKIDMNDAPLLVSFLKKLISLKTADFKELKNLTMADYIKAIKLVLIILAKENVLKLSNTNQFVTDVSKMLDELLIVEQIGAKMCVCLPFFKLR